eukprot:gene15800-18736_t
MVLVGALGVTTLFSCCLPVATRLRNTRVCRERREEADLLEAMEHMVAVRGERFERFCEPLARRNTVSMRQDSLDGAQVKASRASLRTFAENHKKRTSLLSMFSSPMPAGNATTRAEGEDEFDLESLEHSLQHRKEKKARKNASLWGFQPVRMFTIKSELAGEEKYILNPLAAAPEVPQRLDSEGAPKSNGEQASPTEACAIELTETSENGRRHTLNPLCGDPRNAAPFQQGAPAGTPGCPEPLDLALAVLQGHPPLLQSRVRVQGALSCLEQLLGGRAEAGALSCLEQLLGGRAEAVAAARLGPALLAASGDALAAGVGSLQKAFGQCEASEALAALAAAPALLDAPEDVVQEVMPVLARALGGLRGAAEAVVASPELLELRGQQLQDTFSSLEAVLEEPEAAQRVCLGAPMILTHNFTEVMGTFKALEVVFGGLEEAQHVVQLLPEALLLDGARLTGVMSALLGTLQDPEFARVVMLAMACNPRVMLTHRERTSEEVCRVLLALVEVLGSTSRAVKVVRRYPCVLLAKEVNLRQVVDELVGMLGAREPAIRAVKARPALLLARPQLLLEALPDLVGLLGSLDAALELLASNPLLLRSDGLPLLATMEGLWEAFGTVQAVADVVRLHPAVLTLGAEAVLHRMHALARGLQGQAEALAAVQKNPVLLVFDAGDLEVGLRGMREALGGTAAALEVAQHNSAVLATHPDTMRGAMDALVALTASRDAAVRVAIQHPAMFCAPGSAIKDVLTALTAVFGSQSQVAAPGDPIQEVAEVTNTDCEAKGACHERTAQPGGEGRASVSKLRSWRGAVDRVGFLAMLWNGFGDSDVNLSNDEQAELVSQPQLACRLAMDEVELRMQMLQDTLERVPEEHHDWITRSVMCVRDSIEKLAGMADNDADVTLEDVTRTSTPVLEAINESLLLAKQRLKSDTRNFKLLWRNSIRLTMQQPNVRVDHLAYENIITHIRANLQPVGNDGQETMNANTEAAGMKSDRSSTISLHDVRILSYLSLRDVPPISQ